MLYTLDSNLLACWPADPDTRPGKNLVAGVVGTAASGFDLAAELVFRLYQDKTGTARPYPLHSEVLPESRLRPQNRRALALHEAWFAEPDDLGEKWWAEFEQDLKKYRLTFREVE